MRRCVTCRRPSSTRCRGPGGRRRSLSGRAHTPCGWRWLGRPLGTLRNERSCRGAPCLCTVRSRCRTPSGGCIPGGGAMRAMRAGVCGVDDCERAVYARALCGRHYKQVQRHGEVLPDPVVKPCAVESCDDRPSPAVGATATTCAGRDRATSEPMSRSRGRPRTSARSTAAAGAPTAPACVAPTPDARSGTATRCRAVLCAR